MQALVTGGGGFLGRYIVEQLVARGDQVRIFGRGEYPDLAARGVEVVRGDIRERHAVVPACENIDCVFHTAAIAGLHGNSKDYLLANYYGTRQVLVGCRAHHVPRLVYTSSPSVTFAGEDQCGVDESVRDGFDWLLRNRCWYSFSKLLSESAVLAANGRGTLRTCALRPHLIWGPRDAHLIPRLVQRGRSGRLRRVGDGANLVDVTYVENAAEAHLLAADALTHNNSIAAGKTYFISQGEPVKCWHWIDELLALTGLPPVRKSMSLKSAWRIGGVCETVFRTLRLSGEPPMTRFLAAQLATSHWFDISAARRDLGYVPRVSTADGMRRLGKWFLENKL